MVEGEIVALALVSPVNDVCVAFIAAVCVASCIWLNCLDPDAAPQDPAI